MPSCPSCEKWFSEESGVCGCPNEQVYMTRKMLKSRLEEARVEALMEAARRARKVGLGFVALDLEAMAKEAPDETL